MTRMKGSRPWIIAILTTVVACGAPNPPEGITLRTEGVASESVIRASLISLIANPKQFEGKQVMVIGTARFEFESSALFLHREDYREHNLHNAIRVSISDRRLLERLARFNGSIVRVQGEFFTQVFSPDGEARGGLRDLAFIEPWPTEPLTSKVR